MQMDFHYYATYAAAFLAGYSHEDSLEIAWSAQFVDCCSETLLKKLHGPVAASTTQLQLEMMDMKTDLLGLQKITRIWSAFHFLPRDLYAQPEKGSRAYKWKYRLICGPNSDLMEKTVRRAKNDTLEAIGVAMHVLADTWAHAYFAGTPSLVINNTDDSFRELISGEAGEEQKKIRFVHKVGSPDLPEEFTYTNSLYQGNENSIMNLGHGRAGHLPDYSFLRYSYLPAWGSYRTIVKDNPTEYMQAFCQMVQALRFLSGAEESFEKETYALETVEPYREEIDTFLRKRQVIASDDWKAFGEKLSGKEIPDFSLELHDEEYRNAPKAEKDKTTLGRFFLAAVDQKSMVTGEIFASGNLLAGFSVKPGNEWKAMKDYLILLGNNGKEGTK